MNDSSEKVTTLDNSRRLADAIREVKNAAADRDDVVIEMREAERMRLELFAAEIAPIISEVPQEMDLFDFAISQGLQPRFWIDATSHVSMGRDKRTYRFLKDTRLGRVVMAESSDMKPVADQVTRYLAERIVERQRLMEGDVLPVRRETVPAMPTEKPIAPIEAVATPAESAAVAVATLPPEPGEAEKPLVVSETPRRRGFWKSFLTGSGLVVFGAAAGLAATLVYYWDRVDLSRLGF